MKKLYMVYDRLANAVIGNVTQHETDNVAARDFHDALANKESMLSRHPGDYDLVRIGTIESDGTIAADVELVAQGTQWVAAQERLTLVKKEA